MENKKNTEFTPPKRSLSVEFYVGIFAIFCLLCFGYLSVNLAGMTLFKRGYYEVVAEFNNVAGLKLGSPVEIAGVRIGEVKSVSLQTPNALVTMRIIDSVELRDDDIASIRTKGIIGDKYIKIAPGASDKIVSPGGQVFDTESAVDFEDIIGKLIHKME